MAVEESIACANCGLVFFGPSVRRFCSLRCSALAQPRPSLQGRFSEKVDCSGECHLWTGSKSRDGYGVIRIDRKNVRTHRFAWSAANGQIPEGKHVLHRCDTPACVNVAHLFLGDNAINMADKVAKGRQARAGRGRPKLSFDQVLEIRDSVGLHSEVAKRFGITGSVVGRIRKGLLWQREIQRKQTLSTGT